MWRSSSALIVLWALGFSSAAFAARAIVGAKKSPGSASESDAKLEAVEKQVRALRTEIDEFRGKQDDIYFDASERTGVVRSFLSDRLSLGGFFETAYTGIWGPNTDTQAAAASHTLGLNFAATFSKNLKFVSQVLTAIGFPLLNADNDADAGTLGLSRTRQYQGLSLVTVPAQAYVEYLVNDAFVVQGGLGYVPFGHALQQRELVLFIRRGGPQLMRTQDLVEPLWAGVNIGGQMSAPTGRVGYNLYTFPFLAETRQGGIGSRLWWESSEDVVRIGVSSQVGKGRTGSAKTLGTDLRVRYGTFTLLSEYVRRSTNPDDPWSVYVEPNFAVGTNVILYVFGDYAESPLNRTVVGLSSLDDPIAKMEYGGGVNWLPTAFTRFRAGLFYLDYRGSTAVEAGQNRDFMALDLSAAVAF